MWEILFISLVFFCRSGKCQNKEICSKKVSINYRILYVYVYIFYIFQYFCSSCWSGFKKKAKDKNKTGKNISFFNINIRFK